MSAVDPRLAAAVEASRRWYDAVAELHDLPVRVDDRLWVALAEPPPWHSAVKTLRADVDAAAALGVWGDRTGGSVADSFGVLDLAGRGFDLLIDATWVYHPGVTAPWPEPWRVVREPDLLTRWCHRHDYAGVLPPAVLDRADLHVLARIVDDEPVAGAVVHDAGGAAGMSNLWSVSGVPTEADVTDVLACAGVLLPGRAVTDYAWDEELAAVLAAGFEPVGPHRVWRTSTPPRRPEPRPR
ncbi:MAG: hypothetical protein J0H73_00680 [Salana multivorans]|uniref:hypothetical protein n=1 Tax=Salana multivorans TaxID=120377 RepID=UPI00096976EC|nr:hypothetical protein [Salana multivorans]MBN8880816.1 hypothetical protein [Salana multivorans]OJX95457.1 MAG: hypothetical protein BGO96_11620 [Micrococcales bacterium 73-15]